MEILYFVWNKSIMIIHTLYEFHLIYVSWHELETISYLHGNNERSQSTYTHVKNEIVQWGKLKIHTNQLSWWCLISNIIL